MERHEPKKLLMDWITHKDVVSSFAMRFEMPRCEWFLTKRRFLDIMQNGWKAWVCMFHLTDYYVNVLSILAPNSIDDLCRSDFSFGGSGLALGGAMG